jgi:hypothetical protein
MLDEWGYYELVIHPPPFNAFSMFLVPCVMRKSLMKRTAEMFSIIVFWFENIIYLTAMLLYEIALTPYLYLKMFYIIYKMSPFLHMLLLTSLWMLFGFLFLIYAVFTDMFHFLKILCDYKDEDEIKLEKEAEDSK